MIMYTDINGPPTIEYEGAVAPVLAATKPARLDKRDAKDTLKDRKKRQKKASVPEADDNLRDTKLGLLIDFIA